MDRRIERDADRVSDGTDAAFPSTSAELETAQSSNVALILHNPNSSALPTRARRGMGEPASERLLRVIGSALPADQPPISQVGVEVALEAMAEATKAAMAADLDCYLNWAATEQRQALPADAEDLVRYIRYLESQAKKPATIVRRIASIAAAHRLIGAQESPTEAPMVRNAIKAVRRRQGVAQRQAAPLRFGGELGTIRGFTIAAMLQACGSDLQGLRDAALLSLGYDAGLRVSELVAAEVGHVEEQADGSALLYLPYSKTDQEGMGAWAWLSPDTMRRLRVWLRSSGIKEGPLFRRVGVDRRRARSAEAINQITYTVGQQPLSRQGVTGIYRRVALAAADAGLVDVGGADLFKALAALSTHSLRVGLTQDLFAAGADGAGICLALRWTNQATALRYGRKLMASSNAAAKVLGEVRA